MQALTQPDPQNAPLAAPDSPPGELVPSSSRDRPINLGFETYRPVRPVVGKARSENLLWHSLLHAGCLDAWDDALHVLQRHFGRDRCVWAVHVTPQTGALSWELRMLNHGTDAKLSGGVLERVRVLLAPWVELAPGLEPPSEDYALLGLRFDAETTRQIPAVELHLRGSEDPRSFEVYRCEASGRTRVSHIRVREPKRDIDEVLPAVKTSEVVDFAAHPRLLGRVMIPEIFACRRLHIEKRPDVDALSFSGVNVEQLLFTYKRFEYPAPMLEFLSAERARFEHLLWDVSVSYREHEGRILYPSTAVYGCL